MTRDAAITALQPYLQHDPGCGTAFCKGCGSPRLTHDLISLSDRHDWQACDCTCGLADTLSALKDSADYFNETPAVKISALRGSSETPPAGWTPAVLTEYEIGRAIWAAEIVAKSDKPVTEVGCRAVSSPDELLNDLRECLTLASESTDVKIWIRSAGGKRLRYGFYRDAWVVGALDFLDRAEVPDADRAWINGLLFGYRADAIQRFISPPLQEQP